MKDRALLRAALLLFALAALIAAFAAYGQCYPPCPPGYPCTLGKCVGYYPTPTPKPTVTPTPTPRPTATPFPTPSATPTPFPTDTKDIVLNCQNNLGTNAAGEFLCDSHRVLVSYNGKYYAVTLTVK